MTAAEPATVGPARGPGRFGTDRLVIGALALAVAGSAVVGYVWYRRAADGVWRESSANLLAVADLKLQQLVQWRTERLAGVELIRESPNTMRGLEIFVVEDRGRVDAGLLRQWLEALARRSGYVRALLLDRQGRVLLEAGEVRSPLDALDQAAARRAFASGRDEFGPLHSSEAGEPVHVDLVAPIARRDDPSGAPFAVLLLQIDAARSLYPLVRTWPAPSRSAEVLLVESYGDSVTLLGWLRQRDGPALARHLPLADTSRVEVLGALGRQGIVAGRDYRGVRVLAALRPVPGSRWALVAKVDRGEVLAPTRERARLSALLAAAIVVGAAAILTALWRQRSARVYRRLYEAEAARQAVTRHYEYLTRYANDMIVLADGEGRIVEVNDRALAEYGYCRDELLRLTVGDLLAPSAAAGAAGVIAEVRERGGAVYETTHRRKDGSTLPVEVSSRLITIDGKPYLQGIVRDISERRRQERRIADLNRIYALLSEVNQAIVRTRDRDQLLREICRVAVEVGSFRLAWIGMVQGEEIRPVAHAGAAEGYLEGLRVSVRDEPLGRGPTGRAVREGRTATSDDIAVDPAMAPWREAALARGFRANAALPLSMHGRVVGALSLHSGEPQFFDAQELRLLDEVAADISYALEGLEREEEQRRAEAERTRLVAAIEQSYDMVVISDVSGAIQYVNPAYERITGFSIAEVLGRNPRDLHGGRVDEAAYRGLWEVVRNGDTWRGRLTNLRKDGTPFEQETTVSPIRDASGAVVSVVHVARDVTREAALESQLRQAQKMEEMGRLAGGVAHDFNNILTAIIGSSELVLADLPPGAAVAPDVENIHRAARHGADLTQKLLAFSRRQRLAVRPVDLGQLVGEFTRLVRRILREDIALVVAVDAPGPTIMADAGAVEQVLMNLVTNARDAIAERGTIVLDVGLTELSQDDCDLLRTGVPGEYAVLTVGDNGNGMDDATQQRLFEPFFTTKEMGAGTGLGMAMVYRLVQEHKGFLAVDSAVGQGTTVRVYLPVRGLPAETAAAEVRSASPPQGTETILVVEDEDDLRAFARRALEKHGYGVLTASDGIDALEVLKANPGVVALVVSDMVMPHMGGPQLERAMRAAGIETPVVFTSGYPARTIDEARLREGSVHFLPKPWTISDLLGKVREALDGPWV